MPVRQACPDLPLVPGEVVVARPDAHLLVVDDRIVLGSGPRENGSRPSHDAMLRFAALARRSRVSARC
jgi:two-component system chemotaxis response regulator CheB